MRHKVMNVLDTMDGVIIYDSASIDWTTYDWTKGYTKHYITADEILKPYLVSYQYYNDVYYEDIILLLNNIDDVWAINVGAEIRIPVLSDLQSFISDNIKG